MMFVSWSDQNNILIYRTFEEFKRLHVSEQLPESNISILGREKLSLVSAVIHYFVSLLERAEEKIPHWERITQEIWQDYTQV